MPRNEPPTADAVLEAPGSSCANLTQLIRARIRELASEQVLEVRSDDPAAREGVPGWSRLTGNELITSLVEDAERATLPFVVGNVSANADQETVVFLTIEGVRLATRGYDDQIHQTGFQSLGELIRAFIANGGQVWTCGACTKPRGIADTDLIEGARIVTAANFVEQVANGAAVGGV